MSTDIFKKNARERAQNLSEEEKNLKYGRKRYRNLTEDEKERLVEYRKNYSKIQKIKTDSFIDSVKSLHEIKKVSEFFVSKQQDITIYSV